MNLSRTFMDSSTGMRFENIVSMGEAKRDSRITLNSLSLLCILGSSYRMNALRVLVISKSFGVFSPYIRLQSLLILRSFTKTIQAKA